MKRREFLQAGALGAATAAVGLASEAEASEVMQWPLDPPELDRERRRLRRNLDKAERGEFTLHGPYADAAAEGDELSRLGDRLMRSTMKTLLMADTMSILPLEQRRDEELLAMGRELAAEMDYALLGNLELIGTMSRKERRAVQAALREDPELMERVAAQLDSLAAEGKVGRRQRKRLQKMVRQVGWRLEREPIDGVIDEALTGSVKLASLSAETTPVDVDQRGVERWRAEYAALKAELDRQAPEDDVGGGADSPRRSSDRLQRIALTELAISASLLGAGGLLIVLGVLLEQPVLIIAGLFPLTGFVVMLIIGLVTLAIAGSRRRRGE